MDKNMDSGFKLIRHIATLSKSDTWSLELNVGSWHGNEPKYDLRKWGQPYGGVTLTEDNLRELFNVIGEELDLFEEEEEEYEEDPEKLDEIEENEEDDEDEEGYENYPECPVEDEEEPEEFTEDLDEDEEETEEEFIPFRNFFVYGDGKCGKAGHFDQEHVKAVIQVTCSKGEMKDIEVDAMHCLNCNAYFISEEDYKRLTLLGKPLCYCMTDKQYEDYKNSHKHGDLEPKSLLNILGYNTNAQEGLSDVQRQSILSFAIESGLITLNKAISHLDWCKGMHASHKAAVAKYQRDIDFLNGHEPGAIPKFRPHILIIRDKS